MMGSQLYTVTLTDLGTYTATVAADTPAEAHSVPKTILWEDATVVPPGLALVKRDTDAVATLSAEVPIRQYRVRATYRLDFAMIVPAANASQAEQHAKRLYAVNCGPFEFEHEGDRVGPFMAEEVKS